MDKLELKVYAKVNLGLDITGILPQGYHNIDSVMASVNIYDKVTVEKSRECKVVFTDGRVIKDNSATRSLEMCIKRLHTGGAKITIEKNIPMAAGFGGSSADASATLFAMAKLYNLNLDGVKKAALSIGSDVPYMMSGGNKRVRGNGGDIEELPLPTFHMVVAKGKAGASTKDVYGAYDYFGGRADIHAIIKFLSGNGAKPKVFNVLQVPAISICPEIKKTVDTLSKHCDTVFMTGSGSAVVALFKDEEEAKKCDLSLGDDIFHRHLVTLKEGIEIL